MWYGNRSFFLNRQYFIQVIIEKSYLFLLKIFKYNMTCFKNIVLWDITSVKCYHFLSTWVLKLVSLLRFSIRKPNRLRLISLQFLSVDCCDHWIVQCPYLLSSYTCDFRVDGKSKDLVVNEKTIEYYSAAKHFGLRSKKRRRIVRITLEAHASGFGLKPQILFTYWFSP